VSNESAIALITSSLVVAQGASTTDGADPGLVSRLGDLEPDREASEAANTLLGVDLGIHSKCRKDALGTSRFGTLPSTAQGNTDVIWPSVAYTIRNPVRARSKSARLLGPSHPVTVSDLCSTLKSQTELFVLSTPEARLTSLWFRKKPAWRQITVAASLHSAIVVTRL